MHRSWLLDLGVSLAIAVIAVLGIGLLAFLGFRWPIAAAIAFGMPTAFLLAQLPSSLLYSIFPDGGSEAFVVSAVIGAFIQFFAISFLALRWRRRKSVPLVHSH